MFEEVNQKLKNLSMVIGKRHNVESNFAIVGHELETAKDDLESFKKEQSSIQKRIKRIESTGPMGKVIGLFIDKKAKLSLLGTELNQTESAIISQSSKIHSIEKRYIQLKNDLKEIEMSEEAYKNLMKNKLNDLLESEIPIKQTIIELQEQQEKYEQSIQKMRKGKSQMDSSRTFLKSAVEHLESASQYSMMDLMSQKDSVSSIDYLISRQVEEANELIRDAKCSLDKVKDCDLLSAMIFNSPCYEMLRVSNLNTSISKVKDYISDIEHRISDVNREIGSIQTKKRDAEKLLWQYVLEA